MTNLFDKTSMFDYLNGVSDGLKEGYKDGYNKALEDLAKRLEAEMTTLYLGYDEDFDVKAVLWDDVETVLAEMEGE